jgi:hypothetical protein
MRNIILSLLLSASATVAVAQGTFDVTGTPIPASLLQQNYGRVPRGISAYDVSICNVTGSKQSVVSSAIYQAIAQSDPNLRPIGKQIMLASILRNQNRSLSVLLGIALNSTSSVLAALSSSRVAAPPAWIAGAAIVSMTGQQVLTNLKPVLSADQVEKFESQVLEPALVLDGGSCVERTIFTAVQQKSIKPQALTFHVR